jgi:hypothetical protein
VVCAQSELWAVARREAKVSFQPRSSPQSGKNGRTVSVVMMAAVLEVGGVSPWLGVACEI